jgi:tetratricopeptide (TPR) repeat protein
VQENSQIYEIKKLINTKQHPKAIAILEELLAKQPDNIEALFLLSFAQHAQGSFALALENMSRFLSIEPSRIDANALMAKINFSLKQIEQALFYCDCTLKLDENNLDTLILKGYILSNHYNNSDEAIAILDKALKLKPSLPQAHTYIAQALSATGQMDEALKHALKAIKINPKEAPYYLNAGDIYLQIGNKQEASILLRKACSLNPDYGQAYYNLSRSMRFSEQDRPLIKKMEASLEHSMSTHSRQCLHFALGKAMDDLGDSDNAFHHYDQGNHLVHPNYEKKIHAKTSKYLRTKFKRFRQLIPSISDSHHPIPIFIVGMPRSGSTLVDQALASHTKIHSIGESKIIGMLLGDLCTQKGEVLPHGTHLMDEQQQSLLRDKYLSTISQGISDSVSHVVNKQLENYFFLGLIATIFPNAKIIHTKRHPLDISLSCYFQNFQAVSETGWSFRLETIGDYYKNYNEIMQHWHKVLPIPILDVQYEMMVSDFEGTTRKILEFCEIEWEQNILDFYDQKRIVKTGSLMQVREPIYTRSVARWKKYSNHLSPLVKTLGSTLVYERKELEAAGLKVKSNPKFLLDRLLSKF